jgi:hypothetical protein
MGCGCKQKPRQEPVVLTQPQPTPQLINIPQTPEELHAQEMNKWNGGEQIEEKND